MIVLIIIVAAVAAWWFLSSHDSEATKIALKEKRRTEEQKKVIRYFLNDGCGAKRMKDSEYDSMVANAINSMDFKKRALNKIGLDESELQEVAPVSFQGYRFNKAWGRRGEDGKWRSSCFQVSWLFFSSTQVYMYQYTLNMDCDDKKESTDEYFYKDITNFSTASETEEVQTEWDKKAQIWKKENVETTQFSLVVPGDKLFCAMEPSEENERSIKGMKAKLREKKGA